MVMFCVRHIESYRDFRRLVIFWNMAGDCSELYSPKRCSNTILNESASTLANIQHPEHLERGMALLPATP